MKRFPNIFELFPSSFAEFFFSMRNEANDLKNVCHFQWSTHLCSAMWHMMSQKYLWNFFHNWKQIGTNVKRFKFLSVSAARREIQKSYTAQYIRGIFFCFASIRRYLSFLTETIRESHALVHRRLGRNIAPLVLFLSLSMAIWQQQPQHFFECGIKYELRLFLRHTIFHAH